MARLLSLFLALGCATSEGAGTHLLASTRFVHHVQPDWHLRSFSLVPAGASERASCQPGETPLRLEMVYAREDGSQATPVSSIRCATKHSYMPLAVHQTPEGAFVVAKHLPAHPIPPITPRKAEPGDEPGLVPARVVHEVPAQIPPVLQVSEKGHQYHLAVCTDVQGKVVSLRLIADQHNPEVVARILDALMQWRYQPARLNGNPVPSCPWAHVAF
jgi:hypothetical protein